MKSVLVTGGTSSFGTKFVQKALRENLAERIIVFSRDELKQFELRSLLGEDSRMRYFIGDVRDPDRLHRAFQDVDVVVHAAAMKQVPASEYNPFEAIKTNIHGAQNIIDAALNNGVKKVIALSTDKACAPINLYGATKLVSDKLFVAANAYSGESGPQFAAVRYGNVVGSRGSIVPIFKRLAEQGVSRAPITDPRMTRFWITLDQGVQFVADCLGRMQGGEIFVPKIPSMTVTDLAKALLPDAKIDVIGIRPGEKLHEEMISVDDARRTLDMGDHYLMQPEAQWWDAKPKPQGRSLEDGFSYNSENNERWLSVEELRKMVVDV
jgi:UDP-N-acetylglucosamine 4,6-dehydratase